MTARDTFDLTLARTIRAPRQKVFDAFVKPELLRQWFGPRGFTVTDAVLDPTVGGRYRVTMRPRSGESHTVGGEYREIKAPERLVFTWKWEGEAMGAMGETLVTVTFVERRGEHGVETKLSLLHSGFPAPEARDAHTSGWNSSLNDLVDRVDSRGSAATVTVYGDPRSTYVRTVRMALAEKGIAYTHDPAAPHSEKIVALNPFGRVPAFRDGDFTLYETSAIARYVDECFDGPSLLAGNARLRATMEQYASLINCHGYDAMVRRYVLQYVFPRGADGGPDRAVIDKAVPDIEALLAVFDRAYGPRNLLAGDTVTLADLLLAPIVFYLGMYPEGKTLLAAAPNVTRAHAAIAARKSFQATMPKLG
jgi:glutathione S-transferase